MTFADLGVPSSLVQILEQQGITTPTPIQAATLPDSLAGRDVLGRGRTGSGKTYAFLLPLVARLDASKLPAMPRKPRALILAPTRELVGQIEASLAPLAKAAGLTTRTVFGGVGQNPQVTALKKGVDIVIACPGRLEDLMGQGYADLSAVEITILDEADHMADLGFLPGVRRIMDKTPQSGQRMLFSATLDKAIDVLVKRYLEQADDPRGRLGAVAGLHDVAPRAARLARPARAGARRPDQRPRSHGGLHPHQARRQGAGPPAQQERRARRSTCTATSARTRARATWRCSTPARPRRWSRPTSPPAASTSTTSRS